MRDTILDSNPIMVRQEETPVAIKTRPRTSTEERIVQKPVGIRVMEVWDLESVDTDEILQFRS
jgi:hypothetical protein